MNVMNKMQLCRCVASELLRPRVSYCFRSSNRSCVPRKRYTGFTLIELMITVAIVAIIAAIAIPSYDIYIRRADLSTAQQEMLKVAALLEKHRSRNFSYDGFILRDPVLNQGPYADVDNATKTMLLLPLNTSSGNQKFTLTLTVNSQVWSFKAVSQSQRNYSLLLTSTGLKCKTKTAANITTSGCGNSAEDW